MPAAPAAKPVAAAGLSRPLMTAELRSLHQLPAESCLAGVAGDAAPLTSEPVSPPSGSSLAANEQKPSASRASPLGETRSPSAATGAGGAGASMMASRARL
jgi:hypothetical protein